MPKIMNAKNKKIVTIGFFSGLIFASFMAGFQYLGSESFSIFKFVLNFLFFGIAMGYMTFVSIKSQEKNDNKKL
jgi:hypothetical protein